MSMAGTVSWARHDTGPDHGHVAQLKARDVMTTDVVTVDPGSRVADIARVLIENRISAVPVVDASGAPIGIVSEGDLIGRGTDERVERRDWWLELLAEGETLSAEFAASMAPEERTARDIKTAPVISVDEDADLAEIARLLATHRIKRVPVLRDNRIVGIVSRADLVRALAAEPPQATAPRPHLLPLLRRGGQPAAPAHHAAAPAAAGPDAPLPRAGDFRALAEHAKEEARRRREAERQAARERRHSAVEALTGHHVSDEVWQSLLAQMRRVAESGATEFLVLRFPGELCSDGGRAINVPEPYWPETLRGEAAEIYLRWERELRPQGFHLSARVIDFPGGFPGDLGLFIAWDH